MKFIDKDRVQIRVRIEGSYQGVPFTFEDAVDSNGSQFIWVNEEEDDDKCSAFWWREGNMACDCNRSVFIGKLLGEIECGHTITIDKIIPLEGDYPALIVDGYQD